MLFPLFSCYKMNQRLIRHFEYKGLVHLAEERRLVFHYGLSGGRHDIDIVALAKGLGQYCELLNYFCDSIRYDAALKIRVEAASPGSFEVYLKLFEIGQGVIGTVVANDFVDSIGNVLDMFRQYVELKKLLGAGEADSISVTAGDNSPVSVVKGNNHVIVQNPVFLMYKEDAAPAGFLKDGTAAILSDEGIESLEVKDVTASLAKKIVSLDKAQLQRMTEPNAYLLEETQEVTVNNAKLLLVSSNFEFRGKWRFEYKNRTIAADIKDDDFILRVKSGELEFKSKDVLTADLKIEQERLPGSQYWEDKRFCVVKGHARDNLRDSEFLQK